MNGWITKETDMRVAQEIIHKHMEEDEDFVSLQEVEIMEEGTLTSYRTYWVIELEEMFEAKYGFEKGYAIAQRVITELLLDGEVLH